MKAAFIVFLSVFLVGVVDSQRNPAGSESKIITGTNNVKYVSNQIIVKTAVPSKHGELQSLSATVGIQAIKVFPRTGSLLCKLPPTLSVEEAVAFYNGSDLIEFAEPNYVYEVDLMATPNDPRLGNQWGLLNAGGNGCAADADIDAPEAWNKTTGSRRFIIAVLDTGIDYKHRDLKRNIWVNKLERKGAPGVDDDGNGYVDDVYGIDAYNGDSDPMDDHSHGTHVAGTIGAVGDNGRGIVGVMWQARIMALKFIGASGSGETSGALECLEYILDMKKKHGHDIRVLNASWGGSGPSVALKNAIRQLKQEGILFVASAGNNSQNNDVIPRYPSSFPLGNIIAVASSDCDDQLSLFSNWGPTSVDVAAPGSNILSTVPGGGYACFSGTSMAVPHVAGLAGLILAQRSDWSWRAVRNRIFYRGDHLPWLEGLINKNRRINANKAVPR